MRWSRSLFFIFALVASLAVYAAVSREAAEETAAAGDAVGKGKGADTDAVEKAVVTLTGANFSSFVRKNEFALIEFYAPWCGHCKKLAPEFEKAAKALKESSKVPLAMVDATKDEDLAKKYEIAGYPTLKFFRQGKADEYKGGRTAESIVSWVEMMTGPAVQMATDKEDAETIAASVPTAFVAALSAEDNEESKTWSAVADRNRHLGKFIAYVGPREDNSAVAFRRGEKSTVSQPIETEENVEKFCREERFAYFGAIDGENYSDYFESGREMVWFAAETEDYESNRDAITEVSKAFRSSYNFVWLNVSNHVFKDHAQGALGIKEFPSLVLQTKDGRYVYPFSKFEEKKVETFLNNAADGKIEKFFMSDDLPPPSKEPVQVVVGKTFKKMVLQKDKDVLLEVYAPWCGHCKKFEPVYRKFAEKMATSHKNLVVAKLDGTTNESPVPGFTWKGFPTLLFVKAGTNAPILFEGDRTNDALVEFVEKHMTKSLDAKEDVKIEL